MNTRRAFLQSALLFPSLFAVDAFAQDNASPTFADFESGDYSDWTITGDAFGTKPATDALFPGKVRGFGGKGYASTFSPRRGILATGKAVSREFVIEKPVITFRIGGGNHPGSACLNLVVDGKVERTETGDGSAQLVSRTWDVSALVGKTARLEIVDDTQSDRRGYVMVDDIAFMSLGEGDVLNIEDGKSLAEFGVTPYFLERAAVTFSQKYGKGDCAPLFDFGVEPKVLRELIDNACVWAYRCLHDNRRSVSQTAKLFTSQVEVLLKERNVSKPNKLLVDWLCAEIICSYVFSNVKFDDYGIKNTAIATSNFQERPFEIFAMQNPVATCAGFSKIATELAYEAGLKCCTINGVCRWGDEVAKNNDGHSWVMFDFGINVRVPADVTPMHPISASSRRVEAKISWHCLPCTPRTWELFMRMHWSNKVRWTPEGEFNDGGRPVVADKNQHNPKLDVKLFDCSWDDWHSVNSKPYWDLEKWYMDRTYKKFAAE